VPEDYCDSAGQEEWHELAEVPCRPEFEAAESCVDASGSSATGANATPSLGPIQSVAMYDYDPNGFYLGAWYELSVTASDPDGDPLSVSWDVEFSSGGGELSLTVGSSTQLVTDSIASGTVIATADDARGGIATARFGFAPP
jgi:hypothetical protein